jgi:hypothetical protein
MIPDVSLWSAYLSFPEHRSPSIRVAPDRLVGKCGARNRSRATRTRGATVYVSGLDSHLDDREVNNLSGSVSSPISTIGRIERELATH